MRFLATVLLAGPALCGDYHVDSAQGSDQGSGSSTSPWRTLTHALTAMPTPAPGEGHRLHVAPGLHDASLGESFPLRPPRWVDIQGAGPAKTRLDAGGSDVIVFEMHRGGSLRGMSMTGATAGISMVVQDEDTTQLHLADLVIEEMSGLGIHIQLGFLIGWWGTSDVSMTRVSVTGCAAGASVSVYGDYPDGSSCMALDISDSDLSGNALQGLNLSRGFKDEFVTEVCRTRLSGNGLEGLNYVGQGGCCGGLLIEDSLVVDNGQKGLRLRGSSGDGATLKRVTVAGHPLGLESKYTHLVLEACLLAGNADDLRADDLSASYCLIEDGDLAGQDQNFSAAPGFLDAAAGDYRLRQDSPGVDAGPAPEGDTRDVAGILRTQDGDLDTVPMVDVGAHELVILEPAGELEVQPGETVELDLWGPAGSSVQVLWQRGPLLEGPIPTPWGGLLLDRSLLRVAGSALAFPAPPGTFSLLVPSSPALVGSTLGLQAVVATGLPAPAWALSNGTSLRIVP